MIDQSQSPFSILLYGQCLSPKASESPGMSWAIQLKVLVLLSHWPHCHPLRHGVMIDHLFQLISQNTGLQVEKPNLKGTRPRMMEQYTQQTVHTTHTYYAYIHTHILQTYTYYTQYIYTTHTHIHTQTSHTSFLFIWKVSICLSRIYIKKQKFSAPVQIRNPAGDLSLQHTHLSSNHFSLVHLDFPLERNCGVLASAQPRGCQVASPQQVFL